MDDKLVIVKRDAGRIAVIFNPDFDQSALSALNDQATIAIGGALKLAPLNTFPQMIANGHNLPQAIVWQDEGNLDIADTHALAIEAAKQLAIAKANGTLKEIAPNATFEASPALRSKFLQGIIEGSAIESLFPEFQWNSENQNQSFAESLFTLAALFIRLGDLELAESCIDQAQEVSQDSPRGLALKAIISQGYGETLGAVANLVSSLQQYEQRKESDLVPAEQINIEVINGELKEGLAALNKRDNEAALLRFANAVNQFDPFYAKQGLSFAKLN